MPFGTVNFIRKGDGEIMNEPVIELKHITKRFAKVLANDDVSITIHKGEVVALLGENGAGKSTIMKILYGLYHATSGEIWIDGKERKIATPKEAMDAGISMIQQHFSLVPAHTVTENIILGNCKGKLDIKKKEKEIQALAEQYGFQVPAGEYVKNLSVGTQQKVEILKALYLNARVLIMDEPTAVLTPQEIDTLMEFVRRYVEKGNSVVFITHKMREVMAVSDTIIVMRNGSICGTVKKTDTSETELAHMMIGHELETLEKPGTEDMSNRRVRLAVKDLSIKPKGHTPLLEDINFEIHEGDDDDKIRLNQRKPSKYKGLRRFGPEKNLQRINKFMKERPIFYKNLIQMKENIRFYLRCFYCITKVMILQFNSENRTELARNG